MDMDINTRIAEALQEILTRTTTSSNESFEKVCLELLEDHTGFTIVDAKAFKEYYIEYKEESGRIHRNDSDGLLYDFTDIELTSGLNKSDDIIVLQPNGSQSSPDILIIHNKIGIPIEIKSAKQGKIMWNSGYPRKNYIYIFNSYKLYRETTMFLGQDLISDVERNILIRQDIENKKLSKEFNINMEELESKWSMYPRAMFEYKGDVFDKERTKREEGVISYIKHFDFKYKEVDKQASW